jgi:anionic cell wall polymer biosynthesis LytR-Cps2A-Psr (LCP) family protein
LKIDHVIVLGIEDVEKLIDIVGKIEIDVPKGFTDTHFPVPGVDVSKVTDPKVLYEEVSFTQGLQRWMEPPLLNI